MLSSLLLLILFTLILITIEMATLILQATGLPRFIAKFQSISLLTGTGFTTSEAERITEHPIRRRVAETLILFGSFAFAIIIALVLHLLNQEFYIDQVLVGIVIVMLAFFILRVRWVKKRMLKRLGRRVGVHTLQELDHLGLEEVIIKVPLTEEHRHLFLPLKRLKLGSKYGVYVIAICREDETERGKQKWLKHPTGSTILQQGDTLLVLGTKEHVKQIFSTKKSSSS